MHRRKDGGQRTALHIAETLATPFLVVCAIQESCLIPETGDIFSDGGIFNDGDVFSDGGVFSDGDMFSDGGMLSDGTATDWPMQPDASCSTTSGASNYG